MATALTVPLDDWVTANSRPIKFENLDDLSAYGGRRDYSTITIEDAFALLSQTSKACYGDMSALDYDVKESNGPLAYSATLTVTGQDEIGIEYPNSGKHATAIMAKMHAAYQAVQQGAVAFMLQSLYYLRSNPFITESIAGQNYISTPQSRSNQAGSSGPPPRVNTAAPNSSTSAPIPKKPPPPAQKTIPVHMGPTAGTSQATSSTSQASSSKLPAPVNKPAAATSGKSPVSIINELLQKVYSGNKLHKMANSGLKWEQKNYPEGYLARMTIVLPSGKSKSYGSVPETLPPNHRKSKYPLKAESQPNIAKRAVASYAIKLGVLDFIASEDVTGRALASIGLPPKPAFLPPKPPIASGSNQIELNAPLVQPNTISPPRPVNHERSSMSLSPVHDTPIVNNIQVINPPTGSHDAQPTKDVQPANVPPTDDRQAAEDGEIVDEILGSAQVSRAPSPKPGNETFNASIESTYPTRERLGSYEPFDEDDQSESMELDTDAETKTRGNSIISNTGRKVSPEMEEGTVIEEPPKKRQKTEPMMSPASGKSPEVAETRVMNGPSYADILSTYCLKNGHTQPQVTYQRQIDESNPNAPVVYHVSAIIGTRRYELSKHYESVQTAEEKLSKRILKLFGIRAKKA
ncbi:hypothetical protein FRC12_006794 [Ceratobasidium sp. 428]|nr:hypothetical protein FRC12_006794 [Ceratobasidium sp. 428]